MQFNQPDSFKPELQRELNLLQPYVQQGNAILPYKPNEYHRVLRILYDECFPIPTYGRVLFFFVSEVWPVQQHYTRELASELLKIKIEGDGTFFLSPSPYSLVACSESQAESENDELPSPPSRTGAFGELWPNKVRRQAVIGPPHLI